MRFFRRGLGARVAAWLLALLLVAAGAGGPHPSPAPKPGLFSASDICTAEGQARPGDRAPTHEACALHCVLATGHAALIRPEGPTLFAPAVGDGARLAALPRSPPAGGDVRTAHRPRAPPLPNQTV